MTIEEAVTAIAAAETQKDVARIYYLALRDGLHSTNPWVTLNLAIEKRWPRGLLRVKRMAWRMTPEDLA